MVVCCIVEKSVDCESQVCIIAPAMSAGMEVGNSNGPWENGISKWIYVAMP